MNRYAKLIGLAAGLAMLSGCQGFPLGKWALNKPDSVSQRQAPVATLSEATLQEGREQLRQGQVSAAIASFRMAMVAPEARAEAFNGLAVAYAKLGRADIADRYFREAAALDPGNSKFAANLLRLQDNVRMASAERPVTMTAARAAEMAVSRAQEGGSALNDGLIRVSRAEVRVTIPAQPKAAPVMVVRARTAVPATVASTTSLKLAKLPATGGVAGSADVITVVSEPASVASSQPTSKTIVYPLRLELSGASQSAWLSKRKSSGDYPIRIAFGN